MARSSFPALAFAALALLAPRADAVSFASGYLNRSWQDPGPVLMGQLSFSTSQGSLNMTVQLELEDAPELRLGESESFRMDAQLQEFGGQPSSVWLTIEPSVAYHDYPGVSQTHYIQGSWPWIYTSMGHGERIEVGAAPSLDQVGVEHGSVNEPVTLRFRDYAFEEMGEVPTRYSFAIYRRRFLPRPPLVAKGEVDRVEGELQGVVIEPDGEFAGQGEEWFQEGRSYWIVLRVQRQGAPGYSDEFGADDVWRFTWEDAGVSGPEKLPSGSESLLRRGQRARFRGLSAQD